MIHLPPYVRIVVPAFNAAGTLPTFLGRLTRVAAPDTIIVVDDGSSDGTSRVGSVAGIHLVRHDANRGKGAALKTGIREALKDSSVRGVITMDADGQHDPDDLGPMLDGWERTGADMILGNRRIVGSRMPLHRRISNMTTSYLVSSRTGQKIPDSQCGFRVLSRTVAERVVPETDGFEAETEWLLRAAAGGFRIASVGIRTVYGDEKSHMKNWETTKAFIRVVFREYAWAD